MKASDPPKVFDVRRPGRTSVSATSRPVIVGHKPQVHDPMVSRDTEERSPHMDSAQPVAGQPATAPELPSDTADSTSVSVMPPAVEPTQAAPEDRPIQPLSAPEVPDTAAPSEAPDSRVPEPDADAAADLASIALKDTAPVEGSAPALSPEVASELTRESTSEEPARVPEVPAAARPAETDTAKSNGYFEFPTEEPAPPTRQSDEPLPDLPQEPAQSTQPQIYVSHHPHRSKGIIVWVCIMLLITLIAALDILLDAGFIVADKIPHTTFFQ